MSFVFEPRSFAVNMAPCHCHFFRTKVSCIKPKILMLKGTSFCYFITFLVLSNLAQITVVFLGLFNVHIKISNTESLFCSLDFSCTLRHILGRLQRRMFYFKYSHVFKPTLSSSTSKIFMSSGEVFYLESILF